MGPSERVHIRIRTINTLKSNLVLLIAGIILVVLAPLWHLVIAPTLKVVPTDFNLFHQYAGTLTKYANPPGEPAIGQTPVEIPVIIECFFLSRPEKSTKRKSVVEVEIRMLDGGSGDALYESKRQWSIDKKTGELIDDEKTKKKEKGYLIVFPFDTPKDEVPVWIDITGKTSNAVFTGEKAKTGLPVYEFKLEYIGEPATAPSGYPGKYSGAELKSSLSKPELNVSDEENFKATYESNGSVVFLVEPGMGSIVDLINGKLDFLLNVENPQSKFKATFLLLKLEISESSDSVRRAVTFGKEEASKRTLQYIYIPIALLILGILISLTGLFIGVKTKKDEQDE